MPKLRIPLVGSLTDRIPVALPFDNDDQYFENCFPEVIKNPITGKGSVVLNKRLGSTASSAVEAGATGQPGAVVWTSNSAASAPTIFSFLKTGGASMMFFNQSGTQIGSDVANTSACLAMDETLISTTGNLTAILVDTGALEAWFFPEGGAWTQITDSDFPSSIQAAHAHMDGYMFVITERGVIHNSDVNSLSSWSANSKTNANAFPDNGVGLARYKNFIVAFGDYSTQFFVNNGNSTGSVLRRVDGGYLRIGALRQSTSTGRTIMPIGDTVYFLGTNADSGTRAVYRLKGIGVEKVSNSAVDKMITTAGISFIAGAFSMTGMTHIVFHSVGATTAICYCVETGFWWKLLLAGSLSANAFAGSAAPAGTARTSSFVTSTNAFVYTFSDSGYQDNSSAFTMTAQTDNVDAETDKMKFWDALHVAYDRVGTTSALSITYSDDDYSNFSTARTIDLSTGQSWLKALGASQRRAWRFQHSANTACRIKAVEMDYRVGSR